MGVDLGQNFMTKDKKGIEHCKPLTYLESCLKNIWNTKFVNCGAVKHFCSNPFKDHYPGLKRISAVY